MRNMFLCTYVPFYVQLRKNPKSPSLFGAKLQIAGYSAVSAFVFFLFYFFKKRGKLLVLAQTVAIFHNKKSIFYY